MPQTFQLIEVYRRRRGTLYTVQFEGEESTELEKFFTNPRMARSEDLETMYALLMEKFGYTRPFEAKLFKPISTVGNSVEQLSEENLRLYCCRFGEGILIAGNGGVKEVPSYEDDNFLYKCVKDMEYVDKITKLAMDEGELRTIERGEYIILNSDNLKFGEEG